MKKEKKIYLCILISFTLLLSGCQETPDKSSVVSKASGLSDELIISPLKSGEKRNVDVPEHWSVTEKKSNDRVTISANLDLGKLETGNLPVVEMANHTMTQKELKKLVEYFAGGEQLYIPQGDTKEVFQNIKKRIDNSEGVYANPSLGSFSDLKNSLDDAIQLAPEALSKEQKVELKFQKKTEDAIKKAANSWIKIDMDDEPVTDAKVFFSADVGESRLAHIEAECYDPNIINSSKFVWKTGTDNYSAEYIQQSIRMNEFSTDTTGYKEKFRELLSQYLKALEEEPFTKEEGQEQAEKVMEDLHVPDMILLYVDKVLWFSEEVMPDVRYGQPEDFYWQADLKKAKVGYKYVFTRAFGGISAERAGGGTQDTKDAYTSPFPVETVSITVTDDGVKTFSWIGMCEKESTIAENVKLLSFDDIQNELLEQIFFYYLAHEQPEEDTTNFNYTVTSAKLGYTNITAFNKPQNAWLVPAWFFEIMESSGQDGDMKDVSAFPVTINAMDGGVIVR